MQCEEEDEEKRIRPAVEEMQRAPPLELSITTHWWNVQRVMAVIALTDSAAASMSTSPSVSEDASSCTIRAAPPLIDAAQSIN